MGLVSWFMSTKDLIHDLPISEIISKYIHLTYRGSNFEGICPFHDDTKPSLKVTDTKGIYKCFACGAGGDGINFVMDFKKITFHEAVQEIAKDHNLSNDFAQDPNYLRINKAYQLLKDVKYLYEDSALASQHLEIFLKGRQISRETARDFEIGYAPQNNIVVDTYKNTEYFDLAVELGLIRKTSYGHEDSFKGRIMFPISDEGGNCVGFCGRSLSEDLTPKYLNSKESFIFKKGEVLYGLNFSENSIIKESSVLVVEGFMDVVALYEHGITNVVGCMGITLSETCISRLNELSSEIVLGLDSDDAGIKASQRIGSNMLSLGIVPYTLSYLPYKDADDFLKNEPQGSMKLKKLINSSKTLLDIELEKLVELNKEKSIEQKSRCLKQIYLILSPLRMSISATERIILYSELLGLKTDPKFILENYQKGLSQVE